ncbi:hypothetical protein WJX73_002814 [Symbiochloris irregularis]|uniref:Amidohydrolase 3 domain-containing protein n=1 Tax=Symbiochloris irregularis TaxID=706552 RepID=A0AAW1PVC8_9CHLO
MIKQGLPGYMRTRVAETGAILLCLYVQLFWGDCLCGSTVVKQQAECEVGGVPAGEALIVFNGTIWTGDPEEPYADALAGLFDAHVHLLEGGQLLGQLDLTDVHSKHDFVSAIAAACEAADDGSWVLGGRWDESNWGGELPAASWIEPACRGKKVYLDRLDGHMAFVSTAAGSLAGIHKGTADPEGGRIWRDSQGAFTGLLADAAMRLVNQHVPRADLAAKHRALQTAAQHLLTQGVTMAHDMGPFPPDEDRAWMNLEQVYLPAAAREELPVRVLAHVPLSSCNDASTRGLATVDIGVLSQQIREASAACLQVSVHAIGDAANDLVLQAYEEALTAGQSELGLTVIANPHHILTDKVTVLERIGKDRAGPGRTYAFKSLLEAGADLAFGSDWPVAPASPLLGVYAAIHRRRPDEPFGSGFHLGESLTAEEALLASTREAAKASGLLDSLGTLTPGKWADMVVLSHSPVMMQSDAAIPEVLQTYLAGQCVHGC